MGPTTLLPLRRKSYFSMISSLPSIRAVFVFQISRWNKVYYCGEGALCGPCYKLYVTRPDFPSIIVYTLVERRRLWWPQGRTIHVHSVTKQTNMTEMAEVFLFWRGRRSTRASGLDQGFSTRGPPVSCGPCNIMSLCMVKKTVTWYQKILF
jgi:hypothetical protein